MEDQIIFRLFTVMVKFQENKFKKIGGPFIVSGGVLNLLLYLESFTKTGYQWQLFRWNLGVTCMELECYSDGTWMEP